jgi:hypothetical protein
MNPSYYQSYPLQFMALAHPTLPYNVGNIGATSYATRELTAGSRIDTWLRANPNNVLVDDGGGNEYGVIDNPPMSWEQVRDIKLAYCEARRAAGAAKIVGLTHTPGIDDPGSEFWFSATELAEILEGNANLVANPEAWGYDQVVDIASIPELQDPAQGAYYYDGVHFTQDASALVAQKLADENI